MKREFLEAIEVNGAKLSKEVIDSIMNENGKDIQAGKEALANAERKLGELTTERDGLKASIVTRDKDISELKKQVAGNEDLSGKLSDLQTKYDTDTKDLKQKIADQVFSRATDKFFADVKFTSDLAKKAAIADFKEQKLKFDETTDEFVGGKEWLEKMKAANPTAFVAEKEGESSGQSANNAANGLPVFAAATGTGTQNNGNNGEKPSIFSFNFSGVRPHSENNDK